MATAESAAAATTAPPPAAATFYHVLMEEQQDRSDATTADPVDNNINTTPSHHQPRRSIARRGSISTMENDFLARRFRAFRELNPPGAAKNNNKKATNDDDDDDDVWSGASALEKSLVACCGAGDAAMGEEDAANTTADDSGEDDNEDPDDDWCPVPGALARGRMATFVGRVALYCHTAGSRALALAILERSQQADEMERGFWEQEQEEERQREAAAPAKMEARSRGEDPVEQAPPPAKRTRRSAAEDEEPDSKPPAAVASKEEPARIVDCMSPSVVRVQRKTLPPRLLLFLKAGGLRVLSQWLKDATTPVPKPQPPNAKKASTATKRLRSIDATAVATEMVASPTGPLLLPLLALLQKLPFDLQAIKQSRINKTIKIISKQLDSILPPPRAVSSSPNGTVAAAAAGADTANANKISSTRITDPVAGGLSVAKVQASVNELKRVWEEQAAKVSMDKASNSKPSTNEVPDPFAKLRAVLEERANELSRYEQATLAAEGSHNDNFFAEGLPEWLGRLHAARRQKSNTSNSTVAAAYSANNNNKHKRTEELARRERENERAAMMKEDLAKAQQQRRELLRRLRQKQSEAESANGAAVPSVPATRRGVRWRDGLGPASHSRKRDMLEEVFVFVKDKELAAAATTTDNDVAVGEVSGEENDATMVSATTKGGDDKEDNSDNENSATAEDWML